MGRKLLGLPSKEDSLKNKSNKNNTRPMVEIRCETEEEAIGLAQRIIKSGVLIGDQCVRVYTDVYFCD